MRKNYVKIDLKSRLNCETGKSDFNCEKSVELIDWFTRGRLRRLKKKIMIMLFITKNYVLYILVIKY